MKTAVRPRKRAGNTRERILARLRRSNCTINGLAAELDVTDNAVRPHIEALERAGLVERVDLRRSGVGKPAHVYALTPAGEEAFSEAYAPVLHALLRTMVTRLGPDEAEALLRDAGHHAAGGRAGGSLRARAEAAVAALGGLGGDAEVVQGDGGKLFIRSAGCPLSKVVVDHPSACRIAEAMVQRLVGVEVRECCDRSGRPRCCFEIG